MTFYSINRSSRLALALGFSLGVHAFLLQDRSFPAPSIGSVAPSLSAHLARPTALLPARSDGGRTAGSPPAGTAPVPSPGVRSHPGREAAIAAAEPGSVERENELDAEGVRGYRMALARAIRALRSPGADAGGAGEVRVLLTKTTESLPPTVMLLASSGVPAVDARALAWVSAAVGQVMLPPALLGRRFRLEITLDFQPVPPID